MAGMAGMAGMAEWQKEWQNGRMAEMATYVLFMVHTDDDDTLIFYITESPDTRWPQFLGIGSICYRS
jgi:hypothetical protein